MKPLVVLALALSGTVTVTAQTIDSNVQEAVLANAGARPRDRDAADARVIADVMEQDGTHYLDWAAIQSRYGGMPVLSVNTRDVPIPANPSSPGTCGTLTDGSARTVLECFLESDPAFGAQRLERWPVLFWPLPDPPAGPAGRRASGPAGRRRASGQAERATAWAQIAGGRFSRRSSAAQGGLVD